MHIVRVKRVAHLAGNRVGFGNLFRLQPVAIQHIKEIHVAAKVQLVCAVQMHAAFAEQIREHAMHNRCTHLAFHIVAQHGQAMLLKARGPVFLAGNEYGNAIYKCTAGLKDLLHIPLGGHLRPHRKKVHNNICLGIFEDLGNFSRGPRRLAQFLLQLRAQAIVRHSALHLDV